MSTYDEFDAGPASRPKKSSGPWTCLTLMLVGGGVGIVLLCCGGGTGVFWFGMNIISAEIESQLRDNEQMKEHIGVIESFKLDFTRTAAEGNNNDAMVFKVKGSLGEGYVTVVSETDHAGDEKVLSAKLRKSDGTEVQLVP